MKNIRRIFASFMFSNLPVPSDSGCVGSTIIRSTWLSSGLLRYCFGRCTDTRIRLQFPNHYQRRAVPWNAEALRSLPFAWQQADRYSYRPRPCFGCTSVDFSLYYWSMKTVITILKSVAVTIITLNKKNYKLVRQLYLLHLNSRRHWFILFLHLCFFGLLNFTLIT